MAGIRVSKSDLAHIFGVDTVMVDVWLKQGIPYIKKPGSSRGALQTEREWIFDTSEAIEWRISMVIGDSAVV
ncbi:MAG: terminase small subunit [Pseudomonadota bacterium]|nr:terminase small subunit [Pseudomonadota bacterium]